MRRLTLALSGVFAVLMLTGCGIRGDLERPPPVWGPDERTEEERAHETQQDADEDGDAAGAPR